MFPSFSVPPFIYLYIFLFLVFLSAVWLLPRLISPLLLLAQMLGKQLPRISLHSWAKAPFRLVYILRYRQLIKNALSALIITWGPKAPRPLIFCHTPPALQTRANIAGKAALPSVIMSSPSSKIVQSGPVPDSLEVFEHWTTSDTNRTAA